MKPHLAKFCCFFALLSSFHVSANSELSLWEETYANALKSDQTRAISLLQDRYNGLKPGIEKLYISSKLHGFMMLNGQPYHSQKTAFNDEFTAHEKQFIDALNYEEQLNFSSASKRYLSLLEYAEEINSIDGKIIFEYHLCRVLNRQAQYQQANVYCSSLSTHIQDVSTSILPKHMALRVIANNQEFLGNYQAALDTYQSLLSSIPNYVDSSGVYNDAGLLLSTLGHFEKAKQYINIALSMRSENMSELKLAQSHHSMGDVTLDRGEYQTAITHFTQSKQIVEKYNYLIGLTYAQLGLGKAYIGLGDFDQGTRYLLDALDSATQQENPQIRGEIYLTLALSHKENSKNLAAIDFAQQTLDLAESIGSERLETKALKLLAEISELEGDFHLALQYYRSYARSELSKRNQEHRSAFVALDTARRNNVGNIASANLASENSQLREQLTRLEEKNHLAAFAIVLLTLGFIGYVFYRRNETKHWEKDSLTGALNRSSAIKEIKRQKMFRDGDLKHLILLIDLDNFKKINDEFGHSAGDFVLKNVVTHIQTQLYSTDIVGRFGGEEFVVLLTEVDELDVAERVEQLHQAISNIEFKSECRQVISITASLSYLATSKALNDFDELYSILDHTLYKAKKEGQNCIIDAYQ